jgi:predicted ATP-dependent endonuclease of OLD family
MKLKQVRIDGFRSVKERVKLFIDPKVTILIGANDHGKTTLLEAIRCLNDDKSLTPEDENWDSVDQGKPVLDFDFGLDEEESAQLKVLADAVAEKEHVRKVAEAAASSAVEPSTVASLDSEPAGALAVSVESVPPPAIAKVE